MTGAHGRRGLLTELFSEDVVVSELFTDPPDVRLFPQEAEVVADAVASRRREFATVRHCARTALSRMGVAPGPILPAGEGPAWAHRAPRWPAGVVGSMTHCDGYRAAAVARRGAVASLGVDAEPNIPLPQGVLELTAQPGERGTLDRLAAIAPSIAWDRLLFSAKESVFKAWFPLTERWLDFTDCRITLHPDRGTFTAFLDVPGPVISGSRIDRFDGRWGNLSTEDSGTGPGHLATAVLVRAEGPPFFLRGMCPDEPSAPNPSPR